MEPDKDGRPRLVRESRKRFETWLFRTPGLEKKKTAKGLLRYLLDERFGGKADCWPGNQSMAEGLSCCIMTIWAALQTLATLGILLIVDDYRLRTKRRLILGRHPDAERLKTELGEAGVSLSRRRNGTYDRGTLQNLEASPYRNCKLDLTDFVTESESRNREEGILKHQSGEQDSSQRQRLTAPSAPPKSESAGDPQPIEEPAMREAIPPAITGPSRATQQRRVEPPQDGAQAIAKAKVEDSPGRAPAAPHGANTAPDGATLIDLGGGRKTSATPGMAQFAASIPADLQATWDALPPVRKLGILLAHREAFDPEAAARQFGAKFVKAEAPPPPPPRTEPPPPAVDEPEPTTTVELWAALPGRCDLAQDAASALARDFGCPKDQKLWGEFHKLALAVGTHRFDPELALDAYRQAMKPKAKKPGAVFWTALKRNAREHGVSLEFLGVEDRERVPF